MSSEVIPAGGRLKALRVQLVEIEGGVILKRGRSEIRVCGERAVEALQQVLLAAGAGATAEEIRAGFPAPERDQVRELIDALRARRILLPAEVGAEAAGTAESPLEIFYWHFGTGVADVRARFASVNVSIVGVNYISRQMAAALAAAGMPHTEVVDYPLLCNLQLFNDDGLVDPHAWPPHLPPPAGYADWSRRFDARLEGCLVVTSDFGGLHLMRRWNRFCVEQGYPFLPVVLQDLVGYVGPLVIPGESACFECLRARQNSHLQDPATARATEALAFEGQAVSGFHPSMASILGDIAALEVGRLYGGWAAPRAVGTLVEVNLLDMQVAARKVLRIPRCPVCSPLYRHAPVSLDRTVFMPGQPVDS